MSATGGSFRAGLARATHYQFVHTVLRPGTTGRREELARLARELPPGEREEARSLLAATDEQVAEEAFRLVGQAGRVSACASDYVQEGYADKGPILADIAGFFRAFGFSPTGGGTPDHFAVLFEFLSFLALKQAWAARENDREQEEIAADAERKLLAEHVAPYLSRFVERLSAEAPEGGAFGGVAHWLGRFATAGEPAKQ